MFAALLRLLNKNKDRRLKDSLPAAKVLWSYEEELLLFPLLDPSTVRFPTKVFFPTKDSGPGKTASSFETDHSRKVLLTLSNRSLSNKFYKTANKNEIGSLYRAVRAEEGVREDSSEIRVCFLFSSSYCIPKREPLYAFSTSPP